MIGFSTSPIEIVKVGFIGLGYRGKLTIDRYSRLPDCRITALCDTDKDKIISLRNSLDYSRGVSEYYGKDGWKKLCGCPT